MLKICQIFSFVFKKLSAFWKQIKQYGYCILKKQGTMVNHVQSRLLQHGHSCSSIPSRNSYFQILELPTAVPFHYVKTFTYHQIFWIPRFLLKLYIIRKMQGGSVGCFTSKILILITCHMMWTEWVKVLSCLLTFMILDITDIPLYVNRHPWGWSEDRNM
jgi:hypothetical protein